MELMSSIAMKNISLSNILRMVRKFSTCRHVVNSLEDLSVSKFLWSLLTQSVNSSVPIFPDRFKPFKSVQTRHLLYKCRPKNSGVVIFSIRFNNVLSYEVFQLPKGDLVFPLCWLCGL